MHRTMWLVQIVIWLDCHYFTWKSNMTFYMVAPSNWSIFHITGPLWRESTGHQWIHLATSKYRGLWCFLWCWFKQMVEQTVACRWFETPCWSLWRHCKDWNYVFINLFCERVPVVTWMSQQDISILDIWLYISIFNISDITLQTESCHDVNFVVTGGTAGCHHRNNLRSHREKWR